MQSHLLAFIQPINSDEHVQTNTATLLHTCTHSHTNAHAYALINSQRMHACIDTPGGLTEALTSTLRRRQAVKVEIRGAGCKPGLV